MGERSDLGHVLLALWQRLQHNLLTITAYGIEAITLDISLQSITDINHYLATGDVLVIGYIFHTSGLRRDCLIETYKHVQPLSQD